MLRVADRNDLVRAATGHARTFEWHVYACAFRQYSECSGRSSDERAARVKRSTGGSFGQHAAGTNHVGSDERAPSNAVSANATERSTATAGVAAAAGRRRGASSRVKLKPGVFHSDD